MALLWPCPPRAPQSAAGLAGGCPLPTGLFVPPTSTTPLAHGGGIPAPAPGWPVPGPQGARLCWRDFLLPRRTVPAHIHSRPRLSFRQLVMQRPPSSCRAGLLRVRLGDRVPSRKGDCGRPTVEGEPGPGAPGGVAVSPGAGLECGSLPPPASGPPAVQAPVCLPGEACSWPRSWGLSGQLSDRGPSMPEPPAALPFYTTGGGTTVSRAKLSRQRPRGGLLPAVGAETPTPPPQAEPLTCVGNTGFQPKGTGPPSWRCSWQQVRAALSQPARPATKH